MTLFNLKNLAAVSAFGLVAILGTSEMANAQGNRGNDQKQERKADKRQEKLDKERAKAERQRQDDWNRQDTHSGNDRSRGLGYYRGNANANTNRNGRFRVSRNGSYYNTDNRGAELLRQAVNEGYRQGFNAGRSDRNGRRRISWSNSNVYQNGTYGYQSYVDRSQYQYYFRQGFQRGYQDGSNSRYQDDYYGNYQYGSNNGGTLNILGAILGQILNIRSY